MVWPRSFVRTMFVRTMKRDYIAFMPKPDAPTTMRHLAVAFEYDNEHRLHNSLDYRSPEAFEKRPRCLIKPSVESGVVQIMK